MPISINCAHCNKEFQCKPSRAKKYCSQACYFAVGELKRTFTCTGCGIVFRIKKEEKKKGKKPFCTIGCFGKYQTGANNACYKGSGSTKNCIVCNKEFFTQTKKRSQTSKYCSIKCRTVVFAGKTHPRYEDVLDKCALCQKEIKIVKRKIGRRNFCSRDCSDKGHSEFISGINNGRYIHGEGDGAYPKDWNKRLKKVIRDRDGHKCIRCGMTQEEHDTKLPVHHIDYDKENLSESNLITLCKFCHGKMHGKQESRELWKEELLSLLK